MKLKVGLVELAPDVTGGAATYGRAMRHILREVCEELDFELVRFVHDKNRDQISGLDKSVIGYRKWAPTSERNPFKWMLARIQGPIGGATSDSLPQVLVREKVDLVWFLAPNRVIEQVRDTPFVMTVWDLAHREVQGFPEFNSGRGWAQRESWYTSNIGRAFHVATDSVHTGNALERIYGLYPHNWSPFGLPHPPKVDIDRSLADEVGLPFFYYPASFWPHKNHKVLIDALKTLDDIEVCMVFTGADEGMETKLKCYVREAGLKQRVLFMGRVSDSQVQGLIEKSLAVVMPSLLGPTNYPPLEAQRLGKPALVSSNHRFDEVSEIGFIYLDPLDSESWSQAMKKVFSDYLLSKTTPNLSGDLRASEQVKEVLSRFGHLRSISLPGLDSDL